MKPKKIIVFLLIMFAIGGVFGFLSNNSSLPSVTSSSETSEGCSGNGDRSCVNKIRSNFKNSGKDIIGEQYDGDGIFQIQFIEYGRGSFNAYVRMDCECEIAYINVTSL